MPVFLSDDWFARVDELTTQAGDLQLSPSVANLSMNLLVNDPTQGKIELALHGGRIQKSLLENAKTTLTLDADTLKAVFLESNVTAAIQAFMTGKIKVQGDMSQLMSLQMASPTDAQKQLFKAILAETT